MAMAEDFEEAAGLFKTVNFGGVDCTAQQEICSHFGVSGYPTLHLFQAKSEEPIEFDGDRSTESFAEFIEVRTGEASTRPPSPLKRVHPYNIEKLVNSSQCGLILYCDDEIAECRTFHSLFKDFASAFVPEKHVTIGYVACDQFTELCKQHNATGVEPRIEYLTRRKLTQLVDSGSEDDDTMSPEGLVNVINYQCKTQRRGDGLLKDSVGTIPAADRLALEFINATDEQKPAVIAKMKKISGADFYVKVALRIVANGEDGLHKDLQTLENLLTSRKAGWKALDGMKKRYNVFRKFKRKTKDDQDMELLFGDGEL
jgi:protein disulfide-isomerase A6